MLYHTGPSRTFRQNSKLALLLGMTAGFVNAAGFLGIGVLTTNVTGHAALFAEQIASRHWYTAKMIGLWMFLFLLGSFLSSVLVNSVGRNRRFSYLIPLLLELLVLLTIGLAGKEVAGYPHIVAGILLLVMGMQNSLVTMISGSVVRTTHLTGTFTDLGIALADFARGSRVERLQLKPRIRLHLVIILFFMSGALVGGLCFQSWGFRSFLVPASLVMITLIADSARVRRVLGVDRAD